MKKEPYNQRDHVHCFDQENPPCGIKLKDHKQCCLCELPMTTNDWEKKIREICTYSGDEGTSGYLLSEEQFEKIFDLLKERDLSLIAELEGMKAPIENKLYPSDNEKYRNKVISSIISNLRERIQ